MKKTLGVLMLGITLNSLACDICNMSVSLTPDDTKNSVSLLFRHRVASRTFSQLVYKPTVIQSTSRHSGVVLLPGLEEQRQKETYSVYEIRGVYNLNNRISFFGSIPMIHNERLINESKQFQVQGMGDPIAMMRYSIIRTNETDEKKMNHRLTLGAGLKMPLGRCDFESKGKVVEHDIQAGTGTIDYVLSLDYLLKYRSYGILLNSNYKINTLNKKVDYMFGNTSNTTLNVFYQKKMRKHRTLVPYLGMYTEIANKDIEHKQYEENTGGKLLFGSLGCQFFFNQFRLETQYQHTLKNQLNGDYQLYTKNRWQLGITYLFK